MGGVPALLLAAAFAAAPAPDSFRFDGPSASATVDGAPAALRVGGAVREGTGSAFLRGEDRVRGREMTYGDAGELWLRAQAGGDVYRVELDAVGFPPEAALPRSASARRWWRKPEAAPKRPEGGVEGGVVLGRVVNGGSGFGVRDMPARRAAVALWGIGRLYRNDELVAPRARILAQALPGEAAAPSREGALEGQGARPELDVFVDGVPQEVAAGGFLHFVLEGAAISEAPAAAKAVARRSQPAARKETREERLSRRPTAEEQWDSGGSMIVWSEERAPAAGEKSPRATAPGSAGSPAAGAGDSAPLAGDSQGAAGAVTSGSAPVAGGSSPAMASAPPDTRLGAQTVMIPPPPLMAVPATPLTAPIQYETVGTGPVGGGGAAAFGYGGSGTAGVFNPPTPAPSGVFAPSTPAPGTTASPGIPATPPVLTIGAGTGFPQTPQPINAQPAPTPGATAPAPPPAGR